MELIGVKTVLQNRTETAADWAVVNPVLATGEMGVESDTGLFKIGDGATEWNGLGYTPRLATATPKAPGVAAAGVSTKVAREDHVHAQDSAKANDNEVVKLAGAQTVTGKKTFNVSPAVPDPTEDSHPATKKYVDTETGKRLSKQPDGENALIGDDGVINAAYLPQTGPGKTLVVSNSNPFVAYKDEHVQFTVVFSSPSFFMQIKNESGKAITGDLVSHRTRESTPVAESNISLSSGSMVTILLASTALARTEVWIRLNALKCVYHVNYVAGTTSNPRFLVITEKLNIP